MHSFPLHSFTSLFMSLFFIHCIIVVFVCILLCWANFMSCVNNYLGHFIVPMMNSLCFVVMNHVVIVLSMGLLRHFFESKLL